MRKCAFSLPFWRIFAAFRYLPLVLSKRQRRKKEGSERQRRSRFLCKGVSIVLLVHKYYIYKDVENCLTLFEMQELREGGGELKS